MIKCTHCNRDISSMKLQDMYNRHRKHYCSESCYYDGVPIKK